MATTPRTAPAKPATTRAKPAAARKPVSFDIAEAEAEFNDEERPEPFVVRLKNGQVVTFVDPATLDWQVAASLTVEHPNLVLQSIVEPDDLEELFAEKMNQTVARRMIQKYMVHYDVEPAPGEPRG